MFVAQGVLRENIFCKSPAFSRPPYTRQQCSLMYQGLKICSNHYYTKRICQHKVELYLLSVFTFHDICVILQKLPTEGTYRPPLSPEGADKQLTRIDMLHAARCIVSQLRENWRQVHVYLGIEGDRMVDIESGPEAVTDKVYHMLRLWFDNTPVATMRTLVECLAALPDLNTQLMISE